MAYEEMQVAPTKGEEKKSAYEKLISLAAAGNSAWVLIPRGISFITYVVSVAGVTAKVQFTNSLVSTVKSGSPVAIDWPPGDVAVNTSDASRPVTAARLVQTGAGTSKLEVRAQ